MGNMKSQIFFRLTLVLTLLCFTTLFFVPKGAPEYFILIFSGIVNCICVIAWLIVALSKGKKK